jgi:hypothetical protein
LILDLILSYSFEKLKIDILGLYSGFILFKGIFGVTYSGMSKLKSGKLIDTFILGGFKTTELKLNLLVKSGIGIFRDSMIGVGKTLTTISFVTKLNSPQAVS